MLDLILIQGRINQVFAYRLLSTSAAILLCYYLLHGSKTFICVCLSVCVCACMYLPQQ